MIHLLYGDDDFTIGENVASMKEDVGLADLRDVNITVLDGRQVGFEEMAAICTTIPFLADKRLVIVEGLLSRFERRTRARSPGQDSAGTPALGEWKGLDELLARVPETTDLVFVDGPLSDSNPLLSAVRRRANARVFSRPRAGEIRQWIRSRAMAGGIDIESKAIDTLAQTVGSDLRVIVGELEKLSLYCSGGTITHEDVEEMVSYARDANIFATVDAILEGRSATAVRMVHQILQSGRPAAYILAMLARQVRLLILAKDLRARGVPASEHGRRLGLSSYPLRKTMEQQGKLTPQRLVQIHHRLLEADLSIKSSSLDESLVLDLLVAELASRPATTAVR